MFNLILNAMQPYKFKIAAFILALASVLQGCYLEEPIPGPQGPPGFDGFDGRDGQDGADGALGTGLMYEVNFNLNADNEWQTFYDFPPQDPIFTEDVVLVYLLWDQIEPDDGGDLIDVWRPMPVSYFYEAGQLQIGYDFSATDVRIFAEAGFPLDAEKDVFEEFLARIVVVPADYSVNARTSELVDLASYEAVSNWLNLPHRPTKPATPFLKAIRNR